METPARNEKVWPRLAAIAGLAAIALAAIVWVASVNVVFFTARDRSLRYSAMGLLRDPERDISGDQSSADQV